VRRLRLLGPVLAAVAMFAGCGGDDDAAPSKRTHHDDRYGYDVTLPEGWQRAPRTLTPALRDPREILAAATFPLPVTKDGCTNMPSTALARMPRDGALVEIEERGGSPTSEFVRRPPRFTAAAGTADIEVVDCVPQPPRFRPRWISFRDGGRAFYALVAIGKSAPPSVRREAYGILNSLRFDPSRKATWEGSP
jgi:hypothetical protein